MSILRRQPLLIIMKWARYWGGKAMVWYWSGSKPDLRANVRPTFVRRGATDHLKEGLERLRPPGTYIRSLFPLNLSRCIMMYP